MIVHSVTPAYFLYPPCENSTAQIKSFKGGFLEGYYEGRDFIISRIISTDLQYYINPDFTPGNRLKQ